MNRSFTCFVLVAVCAACSTKESPNKFSDPIIVRLYDFKDRRQTDSLLRFLHHTNPLYRREAALSFASIQDTAANQPLIALLSDPDPEVQAAAAFALGQTGGTGLTDILTEQLTRSHITALDELYEALGKVSTDKPLHFGDSIQRIGIPWSFYRYGLRNKPGMNEAIQVLRYLGAKDSITILGASHFFARTAVLDDPDTRMESVQGLITGVTRHPLAEVRMMAVLAMRKFNNETALERIAEMVANDPDYRVRINAVSALRAFPFEKTNKILLHALKDKNVNTGIAASEVIKATLTSEEWVPVANEAAYTKNWRIQANLYEAVLKVSHSHLIPDEIRKLYTQSENPYQRAALLMALQYRADSYAFIESELHKADTPVIRSSAAAALVGINRQKNFDVRLRPKFAEIYKRAIKTGDPAVIGTIAEALADSTLGYRNVIKDFSFLYEAKEKLSLPKDNEALQPLEAAIAHFEKRKATSPVKNDFNHPIDWELVKSIPKDQHAVIKTSRGNITIRLLVEEAPGSVANFVSLVQQDYYDGKVFHRVVPNFVVQAGCNRGDGWGSEDHSIRSEFSPRRYKTGSVGMASAGKDTEGTQWFITHSPTPHLDGRYTIFAEVVSGMDAVHLIEVGDRILDIELKDFPKANNTH